LRKNGERAPTNFAGTLSIAIALGRGIVQYGIENFGIREVTVNEQSRPFPLLYMRL
jgi:hypothetical protein